MKLTMKEEGVMVGVQLGANMETLDQIINQKTGRHVARCLDDLGNSISPSQQRTIKHWFWLLSDDYKQIQHGEHNNDRQDEDDRFNR